MRELVINLHGIGTPHEFVDAGERPYWWRLEPLRRLLDRIVETVAIGGARIALTFDDGNDSDTRLVLPELHKRGLTAGFFVCTGRIGKPHYLDRAMIAELLDAGMTIGSHGMRHVDWRLTSPAELQAEIGDARRMLEDLAQRPVTTVAIPFGSYDRRVLGRLKREPLTSIYTSDRGTAETGARIKPRETLDADMQGRDVLSELAKLAPPWTLAQRSLARLYKQLR
jgi:peptidoglycan/xylan/chitin deacetylase (PgdA/CDA1 family)